MPWKPLFLYSLLLTYGIGFAFAPTIGSGFRKLQTDPGDTVLNHYFLEHSWRWVSQSDYKATLWSPAFFYPEKYVLGYSDNLFGAAPVYWALRCILDEISAYQLWMMLGFALNFAAMAVVLRWFGLNHGLCALGAFLFAFGTPHVQQIGHQQLTYRCWTPFALYYAWRFFQTPTPGLLFRCLFSIVWQFVAVVYVGWLLAFGSGCFSIILLIGDRETRARFVCFLRTRPLATAVPVIVNGLLLALLVIPYLRANEGYRREFGEVVAGLPRWNSWLSVPPGTLWHPLLEPITLGSGGEGYLCGGLTFFILSALCITAFSQRNPPSDVRLLIGALAGTALALFILTLSIWIDADRAASLWFCVYQIVPGATAIRAVMRIYSILYPILGIAGLLALQQLLERSQLSANWKAVFVGALLVLAAAENYFPQRSDPSRSFPHEPVYGRARLLAKEIQGADAAYGVQRRAGADFEHELTMMWAGLYANVPVVNGYSGRWPRRYPFQQHEFSIELLERWLGPHWHGLVVVVSNGEPIEREHRHVDAMGEWKRLE